MTSGDILLAHLPQADGVRKYRPVLLLGSTPPHGDFLVCGLTSHMTSQVPNLDEIIGPSDSDFGSTGLKSPSLIRTTFLALLRVRPPQPILTAQIASRVDLIHPVFKEAGYGTAGG